MSNDTGAGPDGRHPVFRIGERVYLVSGASIQAFEDAFDGAVTRSLDLVVDGQAVMAYQMSSPVDVSVSSADWHLTDFDGFATQLQLDGGGRGRFVAAIFQFVAQYLGLRRDPILRALFDSLLATDGLPRGKALVHAIEGLDTALCEVPSRLRLAKDGMVIAFADQIVLGNVEAVVSVLGEDDGRKLAVLDCSRVLPEGRALVITPRGLAVADVEVRLNADIRAFNEALSLSLPDAVNMLAVTNSEARAALAALGRRDGALPIVSLPSLGFRFEITHVISMDHGLFVSGWFVDPDSMMDEVIVVDHGLIDQSLTDHWSLARVKTDIDGSTTAARQFHAFVGRRPSTGAPSNIAFRLRLRNGERHLAYVPDCCRDKRSARAGILDSIVGGAMPPDVLEQIFAPAIGEIQDACNAEQGVREVLDIGTPSSRRISLIIPLYREMRFIRSQLVAFNVDPFLREHCQIVYVVDDPLIEKRVRGMLGGTPTVFSLDIRLVFLERNGGYALANNLGVREASGEIVVLMNSDIAPESPGWLQPMIERLALLPSRSVIGPKLLYADLSLQHAGMYFFKLPDSGYWQNMHFFKGYGRNLPAANVEREVPAVTGALMLLKRQDYLDVGGFTTDYVIGDYEDSDLCLKLRAAGGSCLYMPSVALMHFERQSMADSDVDVGSTIYNRALHSARWSDTIVTLMAEMGEVAHAG